MDVRPVVAEHRELLAGFSCARRDWPFTLEVEQDIRLHVADDLSSGRCQALGCWDGEALAAIIVFSRFAGLWKISVLATDIAYQGRRQAMRLKLEVMDLARNAGAQALTSHVHRDNTPMRRLNDKLDGVEDDAGDSENPYLVCTVPL